MLPWPILRWRELWSERRRFSDWGYGLFDGKREHHRWRLHDSGTTLPARELLRHVDLCSGGAVLRAPRRRLLEPGRMLFRELPGERLHVRGWRFLLQLRGGLLWGRHIVQRELLRRDRLGCLGELLFRQLRDTLRLRPARVDLQQRRRLLRGRGHMQHHRPSRLPLPTDMLPHSREPLHRSIGLLRHLRRRHVRIDPTRRRRYCAQVGCRSRCLRERPHHPRRSLVLIAGLSAVACMRTTVPVDGGGDSGPCQSGFLSPVSLGLPRGACSGWVAAGDLDGDGLDDFVHSELGTVSVAFSLGGGSFSSDTFIDGQGDGFVLVDLDGDGRLGVLLNAVDSSGSPIYWKFIDGGFIRKPGPRFAGFACDKIFGGRLSADGTVGLALVDNMDGLVEFVIRADSGTGWTTVIVDAGVAMRVGCQPAVGNPVPGWAVGPVAAGRDGVWLNDDAGVVALSLLADGGVSFSRYGSDSFQDKYDIAVGGVQSSGSLAKIAILGDGVGVAPSIVSNGGLIPVSNASCSCRAKMILADINADGVDDLVCTDIQSSGDFGANATVRVIVGTDGGGWCSETIDAGWACEIALGNYRGGGSKDLVIGSDTGYFFVGQVQ
jgi:hypothetical protein